MAPSLWCFPLKFPPRTFNRAVRRSRKPMSAQSLGLTLSGKSGRSILFRDFLLMVPISVYTLTCCICAKAQTPQQYVYAGVPLVPAASEIRSEERRVGKD